MVRLLVVLLASGLVSPAVWSQSFVETDHRDLAELHAGPNNAAFGDQVALVDGGRTLIASAPFRTDPTDSGSQDGNVYSFPVSAAGLLGSPQILGPANRYRFGLNIAASDQWLAVAESGDKVHLFDRSGSTWQSNGQVLRIDSDVPPVAGITVRGLDASTALDGDRLVIGDTSANVVSGGETINNAGAVIVFRRNGSNWIHEATLISPQPSSSSAFGEVVALSGSTLLVGAPDDNPPGGGQGAAYLFQLQGGQWQHARTLVNPDTGQQSEYAWSVALDGDIAVVGCATCFTQAVGPTNTGSFFSYERHLGGSGNWGLRGEFVSNQPEFIDQFSFSLALSGTVLFVGAPGTNRSTFFLRNAAGGWTELQSLIAADPNNTSFGASAAFSGGYAALGAPRWPNTSTSERWGAVSMWYSEPVERCGGNLDGIFCDRFENE